MKILTKITSSVSVVALSTLFATSFAQAQEQTYREGTEFQQVVQMYDSGRATALSEIPTQGWKTGRCFEAARPTQPTAAALLKFDSDSKGPAFPAVTKVAFLNYPMSVASNYFDASDSYKAKQATEYVCTYQNVWAAPVTAGKSLQVQLYDYNTGVAVNRIYTRTSGTYVVSLSACTYQGGCASRETGAVYQNGETMVACYYFKDVKH